MGHEQVYIDPKSDFGFKKVFGDIKNQSIIASFLNSVLVDKKIKKIESVSIDDPNNSAFAADLKASIVDVRCSDRYGNHYQIEMQATKQRDFAQRCQFYTAHFVSNQLKSGDKYKKIERIILISILDFNFSKSPDFLNHHLTINPKNQEHLLDLVEYYFLELPKFTKSKSELKTEIDRWFHFLKIASECIRIPGELSQDTDIVDAFTTLQEATWSQEERARYIRYQDAERSAKSMLETAHEDGIEKGKIEEKIEIAKNLLDVLDKETIAKKTGLSIEEIEKLK